MNGKTSSRKTKKGSYRSKPCLDHIWATIFDQSVKRDMAHYKTSRGTPLPPPKKKEKEFCRKYVIHFNHRIQYTRASASEMGVGKVDFLFFGKKDFL